MQPSYLYFSILHVTVSAVNYHCFSSA